MGAAREGNRGAGPDCLSWWDRPQRWGGNQRGETPCFCFALTKELGGGFFESQSLRETEESYLLFGSGEYERRWLWEKKERFLWWWRRRSFIMPLFLLFFHSFNTIFFFLLGFLTCARPHQFIILHWMHNQMFFFRHFRRPTCLYNVLYMKIHTN